MKFINKLVPVRELVLENIPIFLVKAYLKPVLNNSREIGHYKINFYNIHIELYRACIDVQTILKQKIIKLVRLSTTKDVKNIGFNFSEISYWTRSLLSILAI